MYGANNIIFEFDPEKRVLHLSADKSLYITTAEELDELCCRVHEIIEKNAGDKRIYMVVDLKKFKIDPKLADIYGKKIAQIYAEHIIPGGLVRYGFEITRVTIKVGQSRHMQEDPLLFVSKKEAMEYIDSLIKNSQIVS